MPPAGNQQDEILRLQNRLSDTQNEFNDFTYAVSHDLGAPLRAVVSFSRLLAEHYGKALDEKGMAYLQFVTEGGEKLQAMLAGLVELSRVNTRAKPPQPLETASLIGRCHDTLKEKIAASNAGIRVKCALPAVVADADQCFRLFLVLIDNALTYRTPDITPQVQISATDTGDIWMFQIEDNGIGISPAGTERAFQVFARLHADEEYPGIGMGLALAKKIVERHGGEIGIMPRKNGGTIVWFTLAKTLPETTAFLSSRDAGAAHE